MSLKWQQLASKRRETQENVQIDSRDRSIRALIDVDLLTPSGLLAAAVRKRWPLVEIITVTAGIKPAAGELPAGAIFMPKPLNYERVIEAMKRLLNCDR